MVFSPHTRSGYRDDLSPLKTRFQGYFLVQGRCTRTQCSRQRLGDNHSESRGLSPVVENRASWLRGIRGRVSNRCRAVCERNVLRSLRLEVSQALGPAPVQLLISRLTGHLAPSTPNVRLFRSRYLSTWPRHHSRRSIYSM